MSGVRNPAEAISGAHSLVLSFRKERPLLLDADYKNPDQLIKWALQEVNEFLDALLLVHSSATLENILHALDELYDVAVFMSSFLWVVQPKLEITSRQGRMNGRGGRSDFVEQLIMMIEMSKTDPKEIPWVFALIQSIIKHSLLFPRGEYLPHFHKTLAKASANRPTAGYEVLDVLTGRQLSSEERDDKRIYTEAAYRLMRKHLGSPLPSGVDRLFQRHLLFWRLGEWQLKLLEQELIIHKKNNPRFSEEKIIIF